LSYLFGGMVGKQAIRRPAKRMLAQGAIKGAVGSAQTAPFPVLAPMVVVYRDRPVPFSQSVRGDQQSVIQQFLRLLASFVKYLGRHQFMNGKMFTFVHNYCPRNAVDYLSLR